MKISLRMKQIFRPDEQVTNLFKNMFCCYEGILQNNDLLPNSKGSTYCTENRYTRETREKQNKMTQSKTKK